MMVTVSCPRLVLSPRKGFKFSVRPITWVFFPNRDVHSSWLSTDDARRRGITIGRNGCPAQNRRDPVRPQRNCR